MLSKVDDNITNAWCNAKLKLKKFVLPTVVMVTEYSHLLHQDMIFDLYDAQLHIQTYTVEPANVETKIRTPTI